MATENAWDLMAELTVSCSQSDIDNDFHNAEEQVEQIVNRTGLTLAQRKRLHADIIKAGLHGYRQIAKSGECVYIIIQMYMKDLNLLVDNLDSGASQFDPLRTGNQSFQAELVSKTITHSGWGYFLIERVADHPEAKPASSSYMIEIFLYREG